MPNCSIGPLIIFSEVKNMNEIEGKLPELIKLCQQYQLTLLAVFGSYVRNEQNEVAAPFFLQVPQLLLFFSRARNRSISARASSFCCRSSSSRFRASSF